MTVCAKSSVHESWHTSAIRDRSGGSQPTLHSMWLSRNVRIGLFASLAPRTRDRIRPSLSGVTSLQREASCVTANHLNEKQALPICQPCRAGLRSRRTLGRPSTTRPCSAAPLEVAEMVGGDERATARNPIPHYSTGQALTISAEIVD